MLSVIVSSCNHDYLTDLKQNIEETSGVVNEIIVIENADAGYSLTEAYNLGLARAKHPYLLFLHEDVAFKTHNWGRILIAYFENLEEVGILGIAGASYKPFIPSSWIVESRRILSYHLIQRHKYEQKSTFLASLNCVSVRKVVCLDGVFLAVRKDIVDEIKFDNNIKGFHGYDTDFSLSVAEKYQNYFIPDILIEHFSEGKMSDKWITNTFQIYEKWKAKLPMSANGGKEMDLEAELIAYHSYFTNILKSSLPVKEKVKLLMNMTNYAFQKSHSPKFIRAFFYSLRTSLFTKLRRIKLNGL